MTDYDKELDVGVHTKHELYHVWTNMRQRCSNPNNNRYVHYGGRGITICKEWDSFEQFVKDMGPRPTPKHSIDRIDNNGNYEPSNCRWATTQEQVRNTQDRKNTKTGIKGVSRSRSSNQWMAYVHVNGKMINLGYYYTLAGAREARKAGERNYYGIDTDGEPDELTPWIRRITAAAVYTGQDDHEDVRSVLKALLRRVEVEAKLEQTVHLQVAEQKFGKVDWQAALYELEPREKMT